MSEFTGPNTEIYADTTIPGTSAVAMTPFGAKGNSVRLQVTTTTGGCGSLTFTAEEREPIDGSTYKNVIDRDSVWSFVTTVPDAAGSYAFDLEGLNTVPGVYYRLSYQAATAAGKLQVDVINWENPKGGDISVSIPDVIVDVDNIAVSTATLDDLVLVEDAAHTTADKGVQSLAVRNDTLASLVDTDGDYAPFQVDANGALYARLDSATGTDGAAGPAECLSVGGTQATGELEELRVDSDGHPQVDVLTLPGGLVGHAEDDAHTTADVGIQVLTKRTDTAATSADTDGDYATLNTDASGRVWTHDPVAEALLTTIDSDTNTIQGDTTSIDGKTPALGTAVMTGSVPVTIATDDTMTAAANALLGTIDADTGTIAGDTTSLDAKQPALGTAAMVGSSPVTIATDDTMFTALDAAVDIIAGDTTSLDAKQPALGNAAMAASIPVTLASDDTNTSDIPNVIGTDGSAGPSKALSIAGTDGSGNLQELLTDSDGHLQIDVLTSSSPTINDVVYSSTGSSAIAATTGTFSQAFKLDSITIKLSAAGTTSENFTVDLDANDGVEYDANFLTLDLSTDSVTSLVLTPEQDGIPKLYEAGDAIDIAWPNSESRTYGLRIVGELV